MSTGDNLPKGPDGSSKAAVPVQTAWTPATPVKQTGPAPAWAPGLPAVENGPVPAWAPSKPIVLVPQGAVAPTVVTTPAT